MIVYSPSSLPSFFKGANSKIRVSIPLSVSWPSTAPFGPFNCIVDLSKSMPDGSSSVTLIFLKSAVLITEPGAGET